MPHLTFSLLQRWSGKMGSKELNKIWEVLHTYREDCIPEGRSLYDDEWDDICYAMARLKEMLE